MVFPGEWGVAYGGLLAKAGTIDIVPLIAVVWAASLLGDSWAFFLGRRLGRSYLVSQGKKVGVTRERLAALDAFFSRWGAATVAVGRLVPLVRPLMALTAGASDWPYRRFLPWNVVDTGLFAIRAGRRTLNLYLDAERSSSATSPSPKAIWCATRWDEPRAGTSAASGSSRRYAPSASRPGAVQRGP